LKTKIRKRKYREDNNKLCIYTICPKPHQAKDLSKDFLEAMESIVVYPDATVLLKTLTWQILEYSMFQIPSKDPDRSRWIKAIQTVRRKGSNGTFDSKNKKHTYVCEFHFQAGDIRKSLGVGRKTVLVEFLQY